MLLSLVIACSPDIVVSFDPPTLAKDQPVEVRLESSRSLSSVDDALGLQFLMNGRREHRELLAVDVSDGCR